MSQSNSTTVNIQPGWINPQLASTGNNLSSKCFINLNQINIGNSQLGTAQHFPNGRDRS